MLLLLRKFAVPVLSVSVFFLAGCFPSEEKTNSSDPLSPSTITDGDKATDLPTDINTSANTTEAGIDSMFTLLINRARKLDSIDETAEWYAIDFKSLRAGFGAAVTKSPNHIKANVGFIVSSILSINGSSDLQKIIDSLDTYINNVDVYENSSVAKPALAKSTTVTSGLLSKTFSKSGILTSGQALLAETPKLLLAQTNRPSFPRFIKLSYIQDALETDIIPRLNEVIGATQRLRAINEMSLPVTIDEETYYIDIGDITILEGTVRAARAGLTMMLIYDVDIYDPDGTNNMKWIDSVYAISNSDSAIYQKRFYSIQNDSLFITYYYDATKGMPFLCDLYSYNYGRAGFLSIRKNYHSAVYTDLKEIPVLFKAGLSLINSETDLQDNDVIPAIKISKLSEEMSSFSVDLLNEGFTPDFASKFQSPSAFMDFISLILSQPYTFNEIIDEKKINITIDLSKFFTNPASSLKDYWPKYRIPADNERFVTYGTMTSTQTSQSKILSIYEDSSYDTTIVAIPPALIDSIKNPYGYSTNYYLKNYYTTCIVKDSIYNMTAIQYLDNNDKPIEYYQYLYNDTFTVQDLSYVFPYFNDYTMRGIFPAMTTRQNWIDFFSVFINE